MPNSIKHLSMVDLTFLNNFTKGDTTKMRRYISVFLNVAPETFGKMKTNILNEDWDQLRINAHSLKPEADYMGIKKLKGALEKIEHHVTEGDHENAALAFSQAENIYKMSSTELVKLLQQL